MNRKNKATKEKSRNKSNVKILFILFAIIYFCININSASAQAVTTTKNATDIRSDEATLWGEIKTVGNSRTAFFIYTKSEKPLNSCSQIEDTKQYYTTTHTTIPENTTKNLSPILTYLSPNTNYYFCFMSIGTYLGINIQNGGIKSFKTDPYTPITNRIITKFATGIKEDEAMLSATINSRLAAKAYFRYSPAGKPPVFCNDIYGSNMVATKETLIPANTPTDMSLIVNELSPGTTYYFCVVSSTQKNIEYGEVKAFTTDPSPLIDITDPNNSSNYITTNRVSIVGANSVYFNGAYNILPLFSGAETYFLYKKVDEPETQKKKVGTTSRTSGAKGTMSFLVKDISPNINYQVQAVLKTSDMVRVGNAITFMTSSDGTIGPGTNPGTGTTTGNGTGTGTGTTTGTGTGTGTNEPGVGNYYIGQKVIPPTDAIVRYHEGIETVFSRQIRGNMDLAKIYGYEDGMNLETFSWTIADQLAKAFGYVNSNGKEIRVSKPDIAAYQLYFNNGILIVYEYFDSVIVNIQKTSATLRDRYDYEYYFKK